MIKLSLFSGIGGDDLASEWAGIKTICFVEIDKYCQKILRKHWSNVPIIGDVKDVTKEKIMAYTQQSISRRREFTRDCDNNRWRKTSTESKSLQSEIREAYSGDIKQSSKTLGNALRIGLTGKSRRRSGTFIKDGYVGDSTRQEGAIDIISGGLPCQPHSVAGKHKGSTDERNLWPEFRRCIKEIAPRWVVAENVPGLFSSDNGDFFSEVISDLASLGYSVGWCTFGAIDVGAWHRRDRVFIMAYASECQDNRRERGIMGRETTEREGVNPAVITSSQDVPNTAESGLEGAEPEGEICTKGLLTQRSDVSDSTTRKRQPRSAQCDVGRLQDETMRQIWNPDYWAVEPNVGRVAHGVPSRVDRLKGLGNAVVPQQIYPIYKAIMGVEWTLKNPSPTSSRR